MDLAVYGPLWLTAFVLIAIELTKTASLVHGLLWLLSRRARDVRIEAEQQMERGTKVDWEWIELTKGHSRLFARTLKAIRPKRLRSVILLLYRAYVLAPVASVFSLVVTSVSARHSQNSLMLVVASGALVVAFLTLLHEVFKSLVWTDVHVAHWSNRLPNQIEQWGIAESPARRMLANWVMLAIMGAFGFAGIFGTLYSVIPNQVVTKQNATSIGIGQWLTNGISYGTVGVDLDGTLGSFLHFIQLGWGLIALVALSGFFAARGRD